MGTPHRGSELVPWTLLLSNLINVASFGQGIKKTLLHNLNTDSAMLMEISRQFVHRATPLKIMSFIEQQIERPLTILVRVCPTMSSPPIVLTTHRWSLNTLLSLVFLTR
jgi:hypothetical protein